MQGRVGGSCFRPRGPHPLRLFLVSLWISFSLGGNTTTGSKNRFQEDISASSFELAQSSGRSAQRRLCSRLERSRQVVDLRDDCTRVCLATLAVDPCTRSHEHGLIRRWRPVRGATWIFTRRHKNSRPSSRDVRLEARASADGPPLSLRGHASHRASSSGRGQVRPRPSAGAPLSQYGRFLYSLWCQVRFTTIFLLLLQGCFYSFSPLRWRWAAFLYSICITTMGTELDLKRRRAAYIPRHRHDA